MGHCTGFHKAWLGDIPRSSMFTNAWTTCVIIFGPPAAPKAISGWDPVSEAAKFAPLEQLALSPQCGFASTEEGNVLAEDEQWAKLAMIVELAREIWGA